MGLWNLDSTVSHSHQFPFEKAPQNHYLRCNTSKHQVVCIKYIQFLFVYHISIKLGVGGSHFNTAIGKEPPQKEYKLIGVDCIANCGRDVSQFPFSSPFVTSLGVSISDMIKFWLQNVKGSFHVTSRSFSWHAPFASFLPCPSLHPWDVDMMARSLRSDHVTVSQKEPGSLRALWPVHNSGLPIPRLSHEREIGFLSSVSHWYWGAKGRSSYYSQMNLILTDNTILFLHLGGCTEPNVEYVSLT